MSHAVMPSEFRFPIRVYYEDTDAGGVVYHSNYVSFLERARTEMLSALGFEQDILLEEGVAFVVRAAALDWLKPARFNDRLEVRTRIKQLKRASVIFDQQIMLANSETCLFKGEVTVVCVDLNKMKPVSIPTNIAGELSGAR